MRIHGHSRLPPLVALLLLLPVLASCAVTARSTGTGGDPGGDRATNLRAALHAPQVVALVNASAPADDLFGSRFCGGALVGRRLVLTAAHCVIGQRPGHIHAVIGAENLCRTAPVRGQRIPVEAIRVHTRRDVAVLRLRRAAHATPLRLATNEQPRWPILAVGWGRTDLTDPAPCTRRGVLLGAGAPARCHAAYRRALPRGLCAVPALGEARNTCVGDSGGPVLQRNTNGRIELVALVSWGTGCERAAVGFYPRVHPADTWDRLRRTGPASGSP